MRADDDIPVDVRSFVAIVSLLALSACGSGAIVQQGPSDTLRAYARALEEGRVEEAYHLLSDEAKRSMSLDAFRRAVQDNPQDAAEIARALARPTSDPVVTAQVVLPNGDELLLVFEGGRWRVDASAVDLYSQATPRQAITGFLRAFERKRYDVILRYVPDAEREGTADPDAQADVKPDAPNAKDNKDAKDKDGKPDQAAQKPKDKPTGVALTAERLKQEWEGPQREEINRTVQAIKTALPTAQIEETGDSAAMSYGAGGTVSFIRERGVWKIKDL